MTTSPTQLEEHLIEILLSPDIRQSLRNDIEKLYNYIAKLYSSNGLTNIDSIEIPLVFNDIPNPPCGKIAEPREIVKADNELFRAKCSLKNVLAGRIFMAFASLVDENDIATEGRGNFIRYSIPASSVLGGIDAGGDYYKELKKAAHSLLDKKLFRKIGKNGFQGYTLFATIICENGIITGEFHQELKPFFLEVKKNFTKLNLHQYLNLPSIYSQQLFGFLQSWHDQPEIKIPVHDLHERLDTPVSLRKNFKDFRVRVLEKAHKDITGLTSLRYEWEPVKKGRAVVAVRFIFSRRRALPVAKAKEAEAQAKGSTRDNRAFHAALACAKRKEGYCSSQDNKPHICKMCVDNTMCKAVALRLEMPETQPPAVLPVYTPPVDGTEGE